MSDIILHHYATSPYSEKIRAILGYKKLAWHSVTMPFVMPKPDLVALTGGYRKAPVMQLGRDIYCDTSLIVRVLDRLQPTPAIVPAPLKASCAAFAQLEPTLFLSSVPVVFQPAGLKALVERMGAEAMQRFSADRAALFSGGDAKRPTAEFSKLNFLPLINAIDAQLAGPPFLLGEAPTLADFVAYHCVWFIQSNPGVANTFDAFKNLTAWSQRMKALGHGTPSELSAEEAIGIALSTREAQPLDGPVLEPEGIKLGQRVRVNASDYGCEPVEGTLLHASVFELAIQRSDARAGEVIVHFPRAGFRIAAADQEPVRK
jgi:glutathione S-transferase